MWELESWGRIETFQNPSNVYIGENTEESYKELTRLAVCCAALKKSPQLVWFDLVSLFNGFINLCRLSNAKAILLEEL